MVQIPNMSIERNREEQEAVIQKSQAAFLRFDGARRSFFHL